MGRTFTVEQQFGQEIRRRRRMLHMLRRFASGYIPTPQIVLSDLQEEIPFALLGKRFSNCLFFSLYVTLRCFSTSGSAQVTKVPVRFAEICFNLTWIFV